MQTTDNQPNAENVTEPESEHVDIFDVLDSQFSVDELDVRESEEGFVFAQAPDGVTVEVAHEGGELVTERVDASEVNFSAQPEVEDVFDEEIVAE